MSPLCHVGGGQFQKSPLEEVPFESFVAHWDRSSKVSDVTYETSYFEKVPQTK